VGVQLWNTAFNSIIEILQRFRNEYLRIIVNAPWYVSNDTSHHDVNALYIRGEIRRFSQRYADRLEEHPNVLATEKCQDITQIKKEASQDLCI